MRALMALTVAVLVLAGCGGGGSHTYVMTPSATSGSGALAAGIYITIVSPVALPQGVLDRAKDVTLVERPVGPEICSYSKKIQGVKGKYADLNGKPLTVKVNGSNPLISLVCSGLKKGPFNPSGVPVPVKPKPKTNTTSAIGPVLQSQSQLGIRTLTLAQPIYWAGPRAGVRYEFTRTTGDRIFIRYLPKGVKSGDKKAYLTIATYKFRGAYKALQKTTGSKKGPNGSLYWVRPHSPTNLLIAWPQVPYEVEVYDPNAARAATIAESGQVQPVAG